MADEVAVVGITESKVTYATSGVNLVSDPLLTVKGTLNCTLKFDKPVAKLSRGTSRVQFKLKRVSLTALAYENGWKNFLPSAQAKFEGISYEQKALHPRDPGCPRWSWRLTPATGAVTPPIHLSTTFEREKDGSFPARARLHEDEQPEPGGVGAPAGYARGRRGGGGLFVGLGGGGEYFPRAPPRRPRRRARRHVPRDSQALARGVRAVGAWSFLLWI